MRPVYHIWAQIRQYTRCKSIEPCRGEPSARPLVLYAMLWGDPPGRPHTFVKNLSQRYRVGATYHPIASVLPLHSYFSTYMTSIVCYPSSRSPFWVQARHQQPYISSIMMSSMVMPAVGISAQAVPTAAIMSSLVKTVCTRISPLTTAASAASTIALMSSEVAMS